MGIPCTICAVYLAWLSEHLVELVEFSAVGTQIQLIGWFSVNSSEYSGCRRRRDYSTQGIQCAVNTLPIQEIETLYHRSWGTNHAFLVEHRGMNAP